MTADDVAAHKRSIDLDRKRTRQIAQGTADGQYMLMVSLLLQCYVPDQEDADWAVVRAAVSQ